MWAYAVVTAAQRDYLAKLGFRPGSIVQTSPTPSSAAEMTPRCAGARRDPSREARQGRRHEATVRGDREDQDHPRRLLPEPLRDVAVGRGQVERGPGERAVPPGSPGCPATGSNRCGVYGGSTTGACWGNPGGGASALSTAACPALNVAYSIDGGATWPTGSRRTCSPTSTTASTSTTSCSSSWPSRRTTRRRRTCRSWFASHRTTCGSVPTRSATTFIDTPPPYPGGFQHDFFSRYQTPEDGTAMIQALHAQYPDITQLIPATYKTNGYRRNAMASMGCTPPTSGGKPAFRARPARRRRASRRRPPARAPRCRTPRSS